MRFTSRDKAFLAANARHFVEQQDTHIQAFGDLIETSHLEARLTRYLKEGEAIKAKMMELHADEAANCMETSLAASEDSKAAL